MATQTLFRAAPEHVRQGVAGVVLLDTTHEDPVRTMWLSGLWRALKAPLIASTGRLLRRHGGLENDPDRVRACHLLAQEDHRQDDE